MTPTPGQIYLADQRGLVTSPQQQRFCTLNFGSYTAAGREPFGRLLAVNEESLAPGQAVAFPVAQATSLLLLPVTGEVAYGASTGLAGAVDVEEVQLLALPAGSTVELRNPYDDAVITLLHLWLAADEASLPVHSQLFTYQFAALDNQLAELVPATAQYHFSLYLGRFQGRCEAVHQVSAPGHRLFALVLAGAFELEGRLLHAHDGLALWDCPAAELEALSNDALVLLLELT